MTKTIHEVVVVGGGPAGLSVAYDLAKHGINPLVLEQTAAVGDVWRNHYDGLRLNTGRIFSRLAGEAIPRSAGAWPDRDDMVKYLETVPKRGGFTVETAMKVTKVSLERQSRTWLIEREGREVIRARTVILAVGTARIPVIPNWSGIDTFTGEVIHSSRFKAAQDYRGKTVLVVGSGNSGAEIASRLSEFADVTISVRTPPYILPKKVWGIPLAAIGAATRKLPRQWVDSLLSGLQSVFVGDLSAYGLPKPNDRLSDQFARTHVTPTLYVQFAEDLKAGRIKVVGALQSINENTVTVAETIGSGRQKIVKPDIIVAATGFRSGLADLLHVPQASFPEDWPRNAVSVRGADLPNLHIIGQTNPLSGQLREIRLEAARIAQKIKESISKQ